VTTEDLSLEILDPTTESPKSVSGGDNISIVFNYTIGNTEITSDVTMENMIIGGKKQ